MKNKSFFEAPLKTPREPRIPLYIRDLNPLNQSLYRNEFIATGKDDLLVAIDKGEDIIVGYYISPRREQ